MKTNTQIVTVSDLLRITKHISEFPSKPKLTWSSNGILIRYGDNNKKVGSAR